MDLQPLSLGLRLVGLSALCNAAWVNFDTWEDRKSYDQFSHYEEMDWNYRNPMFTNVPLFFETLPPTTETKEPKFFKRNYLKIKHALNKTINKLGIREKFDRFDKHRIIRRAFRQIQKFLYLNAPEERVRWFPDDPDSSDHVDACTLSGEKPWNEQH